MILIFGNVSTSACGKTDQRTVMSSSTAYIAYSNGNALDASSVPCLIW
jgi:hypothetical protein